MTMLSFSGERGLRAILREILAKGIVHVVSIFYSHQLCDEGDGLGICLSR
jgi:hypothetical protein